ncbi:thymidylate kinase [uncultured Ilyobacter sp.]|uniref:dTMP kinase n=1 Tax=uncultured Ilyobacter sp. TaxID=544433 RepID=UPI0029F5C461|nr:thymidylate kinase [uncultured Ilyobacter sp.]
MGKLVVIEGTDSSGKQTQTEILYEKLKSEGVKVKKISFPNYDSPASEPVKMYLAGEFGKKAKEVNPYPVSTMYAVDRYASFKKDWENFYLEAGVVITDRYTTSNMVHQASKFTDPHEKIKYLDWLEDLEYEKMGIPKPDLVFFLNMPVDVAQELMSERKNKITGDEAKDIHEKDVEYLRMSHQNACNIAKTYQWREIMCVEKGRLKKIDEISEEIFKAVKEIL